MKRMIFPALIAGFFLVAGTPQIRADEWNQRTDMTFNEPVEIPGRVLTPGTYVFKLQNNMSDRDIVQIYTKDMQHLVGTYLTVTDYRSQPRGKTTVRFSERAEGSPEALKEWFYPGTLYGHEFVYPKTEAAKLARNGHEPVPYMEDGEYNGSGMTSGHIRAMKPGGDEIEVIEIFGSAPQNTTGNAPGRDSAGNNGQSNGTQGSGTRNQGNTTPHQ